MKPRTDSPDFAEHGEWLVEDLISHIRATSWSDEQSILLQTISELLELGMRGRDEPHFKEYVYGAMNALGRGLCDVSVQRLLFPIVEGVARTTSRDRRDILQVGVFELLLRGQNEPNDEGDEGFINWVWSLENNPDTAWVVKELRREQEREQHGETQEMC